MMKDLIEFSRRYGSDPRYVLAGGGNTSAKVDGVLTVKASGTRLGDINEMGFVRMDLPALLGMFEKTYPAADAEREKAALAEMMSALLPGESGRPSVECLLHALFPQRYVLHLHPALVNGLTCGRDGAAACVQLFGARTLWIGLTKPGYTLAKAVHDKFREHTSQPNLIFMQNHGVIAAADTVEELDALMDYAMQTVGARIQAVTDETPLSATDDALRLAPALRMLHARSSDSAFAVFRANRLFDRYVKDRASLEPLMRPFNPDQIVYCKDEPLVLNPGDDPRTAYDDFTGRKGYAPRIAALIGSGVFGMGATKKEADTALALFNDSAKVAYYAESYGGPLPLTKEFADFILNWEVENYRQKVAFSGGSVKRMAGKVCIVTGGAQGFGEGIARAIIREGGCVVVADMNEAGAKNVAESLCAEYGAGAAIGVNVNVADESSVKAMVNTAVSEYGVLDVMVACAGILIAGGLDSLTLDSFNKVTSVNYAGYYLCAKHAAEVMKTQRRLAPDRMADIIEINSKSGLVGSKANFAYAGSKFGGIGLTQSFALELAEHGIKVNAICPGNLLDGPLWSDPERGLFRQYLEAGKVPGAKTIEDVRRHYESIVPLGRGCEIEDVARAVFYLVEQQYETGQALPVTGGQVMLN